ncbi:hypothetical protein NPIL_368271 [Nephila pilipes]|uniref:Uncharacterized protein n=1 Tax=Nephila pilipes TaxID=299642 RepID=A0A8X6QVM9_NEPPI|nr:hypothetical protein NPIL_368271 [Nephila pilipes]
MGDHLLEYTIATDFQQKGLGFNLKALLFVMHCISPMSVVFSYFEDHRHGVYIMYAFIIFYDMEDLHICRSRYGSKLSSMEVTAEKITSCFQSANL